ncbi:MAG: hypothetical protein F6K65_27495 [Moorea sp. SIO3C2]|nr:hypothetical protein [Moorena sp. SIO3C2]
MGVIPKTANGAFSVGELNSPRVAPLHRFSNALIRTQRGEGRSCTLDSKAQLSQASKTL